MEMISIQVPDTILQVRDIVPETCLRLRKDMLPSVKSLLEEDSHDPP